MFASEVMDTNFHCLQPENTIAEAVRLFRAASDKEGKKIYSKLNHELNQRGVYINNKLRHFLFKKTKLRQIEGLHSYLESLDLKTRSTIKKK